MRSEQLAVIIGTLIFLLTSCATSRNIVSLQVPEAVASLERRWQTVHVAEVTDVRVFTKNAKEVSIPSFDYGSVAVASDEIRKRTIARKRNAYGEALGDILLPEGHSVETIIRGALVRALHEEGYTVVAAEDVEIDTMVISAEVVRFWSWMNQGFWKSSLATDIEVRLLLQQPAQQAKGLSVHAEERFLSTSVDNWASVMGLGLDRLNSAVREEFAER